MKQSTKKFERKFIRTRNAIERKGISMIKKALYVQYLSFLNRAKEVYFKQWNEIVVSDEPIRVFFKQFYPLSAKLAVMTRNNMIANKTEQEDVIYEGIFQNKLLQLPREEIIRSITNTTQEAIRGVINGLIEQTELEGWGIDKLTSELFKQLNSNLKGNAYARARAIAQTEMISASNQAAEMAAASTGYRYKKYWSTSGLPGIRPTHIDAENYSNEKNGLMPEETFPNGLLYPGDPQGTAEEVINCRCTILHEII